MITVPLDWLCYPTIQYNTYNIHTIHVIGTKISTHTSLIKISLSGDNKQRQTGHTGFSNWFYKFYFKNDKHKLPHK